MLNLIIFLTCAILLVLFAFIGGRYISRTASKEVMPAMQERRELGESKDTERRTLRELGLPIGTLPTGQHNAITDVAGVKVGQHTINFGEGKLQPGLGPARTGVTAIVPDDSWRERPSAGVYVLNGNGCVTGFDYINEVGFLEGPIVLTNSMSIGTVCDGVATWLMRDYPELGITDDVCLPVVGECDDSWLNDARGRHVKSEHVVQALDNAQSGPVRQGAVGAGTGMVCYEMKGGIGTSSRVLPAADGGFTVGVLVNCNHGRREQLIVDGVPVGRILTEHLAREHREGSICIVIATDAPLNSLQLTRLAKRAALGLARTGSIAQHQSGDFILAFSTARRLTRREESTVVNRPEVSYGFINPLFQAAAEATEESVLNALFSADTVAGRDGHVAHALPIAQCLDILRRHGKKI